ncbi:MAG: flagellar brake protein [Desulfobulbaceae bacterium]|nr:flagellar brake protein [Desulfobulbaceae bacterium]HIJ90094.1 flagellar brake protein [Deltaproteobacteria bacterium]
MRTRSRLTLIPGVKLQVEIEGINLPLESHMVGMVDNYIITKVPKPYSLIQHKFFTGNDIIVRYLFEGVVYAFQTKMMTITTEPAPLMFLEYPKIVQKEELRAQKRSGCFLPAQINKTDKTNNGVVLNVSTKGCRCIIQKLNNGKILSLSIDDELSLELKFPGIKKTVHFVGIVKNLYKNNDETDIGISFVSSTNLEAIKIMRWYISTIENYAESQKYTENAACDLPPRM